MRNSVNAYNGAGGAPPGRHKGLTLIELLVAISVLAFIAVLGWRGLDGIVRVRIALNDDLEQTRGMQLSFAQLQSDCAQLADAAILPNRMPLAAGPDRITLVRTVFADDQPSRLQVVAYRLRDGILTRHESVATRDLAELNDIWRAALSGGQTRQASSGRFDAGVVLQTGVESLRVRLWINGGWRVGVDAPVQAASAGINVIQQAPTGLEVALRMRGHETRLLKIFLLGAV